MHFTCCFLSFEFIDIISYVATATIISSATLFKYLLISQAQVQGFQIQFFLAFMNFALVIRYFEFNHIFYY